MIEHIANQLNLIIRNAIFKNHLQQHGQESRVAYFGNQLYSVGNIAMKGYRNIRSILWHSKPKHDCLSVIIRRFHSEVDNTF